MNRICLLAGLLAVAALPSCGYFKSKPPEPVFRSAVKELPAPGTLVLVWAKEQTSNYVGPADGRAEAEAAAWLREHGLNVVDGSQVDRVLGEQRLSREGADAAAMLKVGDLTGARQVVLVQAYSDRVLVRAVDTETGRLLWSGTGQYVEADAEFDHRAPRRSLIRRTLDAIWHAKP